MIPGIDVSKWQNVIDWAEVKRSGVKFAFIKATEFTDKTTTLDVDNQFKSNAEGAKSSGIHWGAIHFFRSHIDPVIQAKVFCETVGEFSSLPPVLDLETAKMKGERLNIKVRQFLEEVERISSRKPIIHTSGGFWQSYMASEKRDQTDWARIYPLYLAHFTSLWPNSPYPWIGWDFWQNSDQGNLPGITTHVKLNLFNGSEKELSDRFVQRNGMSKAPEMPIEIMGLQPSNNEKNSVDLEYKGDYQEAQQSPNAQYPQYGLINGAEAKYSNQEENWIRSYFF